MAKDILNAIEAEQTYLHHKLKGESVSPLIDKIKACGFETLEEYFNDKMKYRFSQLEFAYEECIPQTCLQQVFSAINNKETKFLFMISDHTFVFNCSDDFNIDYCEQNGIPIYYTQAGGGTIVSTEGDVSFCICAPCSININANFILRNIASIIDKGSGIAEVDGNDILIDRKKILGSTSYRMNDMIAVVAHVSFKDNSDLISKICTSSKLIKIPSYIQNISQEDFRAGVMKWLHCI